MKLFSTGKNVGFKKTNGRNATHEEALASVPQLVGHHPIPKRLLVLFPVPGSRAQSSVGGMQEAVCRC